MMTATATLPTTGKELEKILKRDFATIQAQYKRKVKAGDITDIPTLTTDNITEGMLWNVCNVCYPTDLLCMDLSARLSVLSVDRQPNRQTDNVPTSTDNTPTSTDIQEVRQAVQIENLKSEHQILLDAKVDQVKNLRLELREKRELIQNLEKELFKANLQGETVKQTLQTLQADKQTSTDILTDIQDRHDRQLKDMTDKHGLEMSAMSEMHRQEMSEMSAQMSEMSAKYNEAKTIILQQNSKQSFFQAAGVVLVCFVGVVVYQSYETSLGLLKFHTISGKEIPYLLAIGCAVLIGLFGIILTMNTPKNEYGEYDMAFLRNYDIGVFLLNLYVFLPDVISSQSTHWQDYAATGLYCATMPFIEYTFGSIYLSKKQEQENRISAVKD